MLKQLQNVFIATLFRNMFKLKVNFKRNVINLSKLKWEMGEIKIENVCLPLNYFNLKFGLPTVRARVYKNITYTPCCTHAVGKKQLIN